MQTFVEMDGENIGKGGMKPSGLALEHPAAAMLKEWATMGCPEMMRRDWTLVEMEAAIAEGPHELALTPDALEYFQKEVAKKVMCQQAWVVEWEATKHNQMKQLKI